MTASKENAPAERGIPRAAAAKPRDKRAAAGKPPAPTKPAKPTEHGGPAGPEPTRFGDWERNGRCVDF